MTTTLVAVYAPIGFMGGLVGSLFIEFAFTLAGAVVIIASALYIARDESRRTVPPLSEPPV